MTGPYDYDLDLQFIETGSDGQAPMTDEEAMEIQEGDSASDE